MTWFRHSIDSWHLDCEVDNEKHDFLASITKNNDILELFIPSSNLTKAFHTVEELNDFLNGIGIEIIKLSI